MNKEDIVKRLKDLRDQESQNDYAQGKQAGRDWAERDATPKELQRIAVYVEVGEGNRCSWWDDCGILWGYLRGGPGAIVFAARALQRDGQDYSDVKSFWEAAFGGVPGCIADGDFVHGFGDGVVEVWNEVKDSLLGC